MNLEFIKNRIASIEQRIEAYEQALLALGDGIQSYTLDTGQNRQTVTQKDVFMLQKTLDKLYDQHQIFTNRLCGGGSVIGRPLF